MGFGGLDIALSGLRVAQQQLSVIANNVSNVNTEGYSRKILPQATVAIEGISVGVRGNSIIRNVDLNLERDLWTQVSTVEFLGVKETFLNRIQQFHGPPNLEISIAAELGQLRDQFTSLADSPEDNFLQRAAVDQAVLLAGKINNFSDLLTQMRNDAQDEILVSINKINTNLEQIADLNGQIKFNQISGKTTAALEDARDAQISRLSEEIEISFFTRGDGVLVVQTSNGVQLADERAETLFFDPTVIGPNTFFPDPANPDIGSIFVGGSPITNPVAINITQSELNGKVGALLELRDDTLPRQQAMLDELAQKLASRFQAQGLTLFTDASGSVPADTPPDPTILPLPTPVTYVGFASEIQVNRNIINDNSLIQQGTVPTDNPVQSGSNEVVRRVLEFVFGDVDHQEAIGTVDLRAAASGGVTMQEWLGIFSENSITSTVDLTSYGSVAALIAAGGDVFTPPVGPVTDTFRLTFDEPRTGISVPPLLPGDLDFDISLNAADLQPGATAADQIAAEINAQIALRVGAVPSVANLNIVASVNPFGQLVIGSRGNITIDQSSFPGGIGPDGLEFIGLEAGTFQTTDPYIEVQVGNDPPTRITIEPGDDETTLVDKLNLVLPGDPLGGVPGLGVFLDPATGLLTIRPGDDVNAPTFGGDIRIFGGPFQTTVPGGSGVALGSTIVSALFGSDNPTSDILYQSEIAVGSGTFESFRRRNLGPGANINTGIISSSNLIDYAQKMINKHTEESISTDARIQDETSFRDLLQRRLLDESGVNLDEELSNLIIIQTAFAASARVIAAIDEEFQELLNAVL